MDSLPQAQNTEISHGAAVAAGGFRIRARWVKIWLACLAWWFPLWWLAAFLIFAGPALGEWFVRGTPLRYLRINLWLPLAVSELPSVLWRGPQFVAMRGALAVVAVALVITALVARKAEGGRRVLAGLTLSVAAIMGMLASVTTFGTRLMPASIGAVLISFGVMILGFWWMVSGWCPRRYWVRVVSLLAAFELPLAVLLGLAAVFHSPSLGPTWRDIIFLLPGAAGALVVSIPEPRISSEPSPARWQPVVNGMVISVLLAAGVAKVGAFITNGFQQIKLADNRDALAELPKIADNAPYPTVFFQKGVSLSAEWPDPYESQGAREMLLQLKNYGVDAIALVPYASMRESSPEVRGFGRNSLEGDEGLREMARLAHALGMKVMLKPGIWVRGGNFAGDVDFPPGPERERFFANYEKFIDRYARLATAIHADLFCVGGEFVKLSSDEQGWRRLIASVRALYPGPVTYAASFGTEFETLKFWDALDYIGLQNYYPLPADFSTHEEVAKIETVQKQYGKPVIFTEAGFPSAPGGNEHPWEDGKPGKPAPELQARCYQAIFQTFYSKPWFEGMYWWKIGSNGAGGPQDTSLTPWNKPAMQVVKQWYTSAAR